MGEANSNELLSIPACNAELIDSSTSIDVGEAPKSYRLARNCWGKAKLLAHAAPDDRVEGSRIRAMKKELMHYRTRLDQMVHLRTEMLNRRLAILESCNSRLGENYHQMHQMYLDLLVRTQAYEAHAYQHVLEGELAMLGQTEAIEVESI